MAHGLSPSLSQGVTLPKLLFQRIHRLEAITSLQRESKLDLKIQIPPHRDPDFITVLYCKSVTCSFGEQGCDFFVSCYQSSGGLMY